MCLSSDRAADAGMIDSEGVNVGVGLSLGKMFMHKDASDVVGSMESEVGGVIESVVLGLGTTFMHKDASEGLE